MRANILVPQHVIELTATADLQVVTSLAPDCEPVVVIRIGSLHIEFAPDEAMDLGSDILKCCDDVFRVTEGREPLVNPTTNQEEGS